MAEVWQESNVTDLNGWSSIVDAEGDLNWASAAGMKSGTGGIALTVDNATVTYVQGTLSATSSTEYRYEFYIDRNTLSLGSGEEFQMIQLRDGGGNLSGWVELQNVAGTYKLSFILREDDATQRGAAVNMEAAGTAARYEVHIHKATGISANDGYITVWKDGDFATPIVNVTDIDIWSTWRTATVVRVGVLNGAGGTPSGDLWLDEITVRNDGTQIGAAALPVVTDPGDASYTTIGVAESIPITVAAANSDITSIRFQCTSGTGTVDLVDLDSGVSVSAGARGSADVTFTGTHAQCVAAALDFEYTAVLQGADTGVIATATSSTGSDAETFTVTNYYMTIVATSESDLNAALATLTATNAVAETATMTVLGTDAGGRTDEETANIVTLALTANVITTIDDLTDILF